MNGIYGETITLASETMISKLSIKKRMEYWGSKISCIHILIWVPVFQIGSKHVFIIYILSLVFKSWSMYKYLDFRYWTIIGECPI